MKRRMQVAALLGLAILLLSSPSYGDDTWKDTVTSLMWQVEPTGGSLGWTDATAHCENLNLSGFSDWRLPTISELRSLVRGCEATETGGSCNVTDDCLTSDCRNDACEGCSEFGGPGSNGNYWPDELSGDGYGWHWSSSPVTDDDYGWHVGFYIGGINGPSAGPGTFLFTRCVRDYTTTTTTTSTTTTTTIPADDDTGDDTTTDDVTDDAAGDDDDDDDDGGCCG